MLRETQAERLAGRQGEPSLLEVLRGATRSAHERVEALPAMLRLVSPDYTEREYVAHLGRMLGFYEPLEAALARSDGDSSFISNRSPRLRRDLTAGGITSKAIDALPRCDTVSPLSPAGRLGGMYVYEGAALGGQIIARRLRQSLGAHEFAFYHEDGLETARAWKAFCLATQTDETRLSFEEICASAIAVFAAFEGWFDRPLASISVHA